MFLDDLIVFFVEIICLLVEGVITAFAGIVNLLAGLVEIIIGLFVSGFKLRRIKRPERNEADGAKPTWLAPRTSLISFFITLGIIFSIPAVDSLMNRKITLSAKDGHTLPYAILIVHTKDGQRRKLTNKSGKVRIPRFSTTALTVNDPRYVARTWQESEITRELTVDRSLLGSSLDIVTGRLREHSKRADETKPKAKPND